MDNPAAEVHEEDSIELIESNDKTFGIGGNLLDLFAGSYI